MANPLVSDIPQWDGPMPDGCECDGPWWSKPSPICDEYVPDILIPGQCGNCEHDRNCHTW